MYAGVYFLYPDEVELRFNPYHVPHNGRFISGPSSFSGICLIRANGDSDYADYDGKYVGVEKGQIVEVVEDYIPVRQKITSMKKQDKEQATSEPDSEETPEKIPCINSALEGKSHLVTGVPFVGKVIEVDGIKKKVVVPVFEHKAMVKLADEYLQVSDKRQFRISNKKLYEEILKDDNLIALFSEIDIARLQKGKTPQGYTWHHYEETGQMQLVNSEIHNKTAHTGGKNFWGGGSEKRSLEENI